MTKTQAIIVALIGAAYFVVSLLSEGTAQSILAFASGLHICAAFTIKGE